MSQPGSVPTLPPEIIGIALSYLEGDVSTLRVCSLVCASWAALARPYLFRRVVCRPRVPSCTWDDFFRFLSTAPDLVGYVQWLTVDGGIPGNSADDLVVENVLEALEKLPSLTRLSIRRWRFYSLKSGDKYAEGVAAPMSSSGPRPRRLKLLSLESCIVKRSLPSSHTPGENDGCSPGPDDAGVWLLDVPEKQTISYGGLGVV